MSKISRLQARQQLEVDLWAKLGSIEARVSDLVQSIYYIAYRCAISTFPFISPN